MNTLKVLLILSWYKLGRAGASDEGKMGIILAQRLKEFLSDLLFVIVQYRPKIMMEFTEFCLKLDFFYGRVSKDSIDLLIAIGATSS